MHPCDHSILIDLRYTRNQVEHACDVNLRLGMSCVERQVHYWNPGSSQEPEFKTSSFH